MSSHLCARSLVLFWSVTWMACAVVEEVDTFFRPDQQSLVALRIGVLEFTQSDLQRHFDSRLRDFQDWEHMDRAKSGLLDGFIEEHLLLQEANRRGVAPDIAAIKATMQQILVDDPARESAVRDDDLEQVITESLRSQRYLNDYVFKDIQVSRDECRKFFKEHGDEFSQKDLVDVREILVDNITLAEEIRDALKENRNQNFAELARLYSLAASASEGGRLGRIEPGELPEEFEKVIFRLAPGSVSKIIQTKYGHHIFMVEEKILAHHQKFYEVEAQIRDKLRLEQERERLVTELQSLLNRTEVEIHPERLDFEYTARFSP